MSGSPEFSRSLGRTLGIQLPGSCLRMVRTNGCIADTVAAYFLHALRNLSLSMAAGNATLWKPAPTTPLCAVAVTKIVSKVLEKNGIPGAVAGLVCGGKDVGEAVVGSKDVDMGMSRPHFRATQLFYSPRSSLFHWERSRREDRWKSRSRSIRQGSPGAWREQRRDSHA